MFSLAEEKCMSFGGGSGGSNSIQGATDVFLSSPSNGQVLAYDATTLKWVNAAGAGNNVRFYTGSAWQPRGTSPYPVTFDAGLTDPVSQPTDWLPGDHIISLNPPVAP